MGAIRVNDITVDEIIDAFMNCCEDSDCTECICYMKDDCRLNHLSDKEETLLKNKQIKQ